MGCKRKTHCILIEDWVISLRAPNKTLLYKHLQMQNIEGWSERFCHLSCGRRSSL